MARVFITGSSDGLGLMVAKLLVDEGHDLVPQGRNEARRKSRKVACDRVLDVSATRYSIAAVVSRAKRARAVSAVSGQASRPS